MTAVRILPFSRRTQIRRSSLTHKPTPTLQYLLTRAGRRPLARTTALLLGLVVLGACADETTAPTTNAASRAAPNAAVSPAQAIAVTIEQAAIPSGYAGAFVGLTVTCSTNQLVDVVAGVEQDQKLNGTKTLATGLGIVLNVECTPAGRPVLVPVTPYPGSQFQAGRATVNALVQSTQPGVEPANATRRMRLEVL